MEEKSQGQNKIKGLNLQKPYLKPKGLFTRMCLLVIFDHNIPEYYGTVTLYQFQCRSFKKLCINLTYNISTSSKTCVSTDLYL